MDPSSPTKAASAKSSTLNSEDSSKPQPSPLTKLVAVASIAAGIQFGWALQLSLLTPYVQLLGVPHTWAAFIWLCGPISGLVVQPIVGYYSDRSTSRFGRRRPFIFYGAIAVAVAVFLIGYAADIGYAVGDDITKKTRPRAVAIFVVLGYAAGSYRNLHNIFPFTETKACDVFCANLKSCFFFSILLLLILVIVVLIYVQDPKMPAAEVGEEGKATCFGEIFGALKELKKPMWMLMLVTAINWIGWFPYFLFDTDWMGREVYGGNVGDEAYASGVRAGSLGLMLNAVVLGVMSLAVEPLGRMVGGVKRLWGIVNIILAIALAMTMVITKNAKHERLMHHTLPGQPSQDIKISALIFFSVVGIPLAITYSVPFALASIYSSTSGAGQGLSLGVLNLAIVIPQMLVSALSGPWDALFGGGNLPAFVLGAVASAVTAVLAIILLPNPKPEEARAASFAAGSFH
ncbi:hypothetical protein VNO77_34006 [Canavalia gladiata]|uniref:Uncharacterized protein n=1 Tax=Canavalia gladiata TaxID=3824 RepID=A0AAN9KGU3_CANGL